MFWSIFGGLETDYGCKRCLPTKWWIVVWVPWTINTLLLFLSPNSSPMKVAYLCGHHLSASRYSSPCASSALFGSYPRCVYLILCQRSMNWKWLVLGGHKEKTQRTRRTPTWKTYQPKLRREIRTLLTNRRWNYWEIWRTRRLRKKCQVSKASWCRPCSFGTLFGSLVIALQAGVSLGDWIQRLID